MLLTLHKNGDSDQNNHDIQGVPINTLSECCWSHSSLAQSPFADTPCVWRLIFWAFLTKTKRRIKPSQVMSIEKFSPIALNFGYDFVLLVHFFGDTLQQSSGQNHNYCYTEKRYLQIIAMASVMSSNDLGILEPNFRIVYNSCRYKSGFLGCNCVTKAPLLLIRS